MALKVWVALTAPAAMAARVSAAVALEWPTETRTPREVACAASSMAPGNSGASVIRRTWPWAASMRRSKVAMLGARRCSAGCTPRFSCERNGPSRWMPSGRARPGSRQLRDFVGQAVERAQCGVERCGDGGGEVGAGAARCEKRARWCRAPEKSLPSRRGRQRRGCEHRKMRDRGWRRESRARVRQQETELFRGWRSSRFCRLR